MTQTDKDKQNAIALANKILPQHLDVLVQHLLTGNYNKAVKHLVEFKEDINLLSNSIKNLNNEQGK